MISDGTILILVVVSVIPILVIAFFAVISGRE